VGILGIKSSDELQSLRTQAKKLIVRIKAKAELGI
jgi:hypothetical protein